MSNSAPALVGLMFAMAFAPTMIRPTALAGPLVLMTAGLFLLTVRRTQKPVEPTSALAE